VQSAFFGAHPPAQDLCDYNHISLTFSHASAAVSVAPSTAMSSPNLHFPHQPANGTKGQHQKEKKKEGTGVETPEKIKTMKGPRF
jgi:hypothetical protein